MKRVMLAITFIFILSGVGSNVLAAPVISSVSGALSDSQTITIVGTGFGTKTTAGPMLFGDFENGTSGQSITASSPNVYQGGLSSYSAWQKSGGNSLLINNTSPLENSTKHARVSFPNPSTWYTFVSVPYNFSTVGQKLYVSFDYKIAIENEMPRQAKALIYYDSDEQDKMYMSTAFDRCEDGGWRMHVTQGSGMTGNYYMNTTGPSVNNEWVRLENYIVQSGVSVTNGRWDGAIIKRSSIDKNSTTGSFRSASTNWVQMAIGGGFYDPCDSSDPGTVDVDNIYIDSTPQRVEIGNASTWASTTNREILLPTAWSNTSITATTRQGRFTTGQTAYLFVVDSTGTVNNNGYPVTIGSVTGTPPPAPAPTVPPATPQGLRIITN